MARLTITLSDDRHRALKEAAARQGRTIGELIEESLERAGIKTGDEASALVARARHASQLGVDEALDIAVEATRDVRRG